MRLAIIGAAGLGRQIAEHARTNQGWTIAGYYEDRPAGGEFNGAPVLGTTDCIEKDYARGRFDQIMVGIGYNRMEARSLHFERLKGRVPFANLIHPSAYVHSSCKMGEGVFLYPGVTIDMAVQLQDNVLIHVGGIVAHDSAIGPHSYLSPGVNVAGFASIGRCCFIGIGATIIDGIVIAPNSTVGAGSVVIRDTDPYSVSVGVPAKQITVKAGKKGALPNSGGMKSEM